MTGASGCQIWSIQAPGIFVVQHLHRVLSYALLKVVAVSTRGSRGSITTDKGRKTNKCNTRRCVNMFDLKGTEGDCSSSPYQCIIGKIGTALPPFLFSLYVLSHLMLLLCSEIQLLMRLFFNNSKKSNICKKLRRFGSISSIRISTQTIYRHKFSDNIWSLTDADTMSIKLLSLMGKLHGRYVSHPVSCRDNIWNIIVLWAKSSKLCSILVSLII